jgi:hypothetical protein
VLRNRHEIMETFSIVPNYIQLNILRQKYSEFSFFLFLFCQINIYAHLNVKKIKNLKRFYTYFHDLKLLKSKRLRGKIVGGNLVRSWINVAIINLNMRGNKKM